MNKAALKTLMEHMKYRNYKNSRIYVKHQAEGRVLTVVDKMSQPLPMILGFFSNLAEADCMI